MIAVHDVLGQFGQRGELVEFLHRPGEQAQRGTGPGMRESLWRGTQLRRRSRVLGTALVPHTDDAPAVDPEVLTALAVAAINRERVRFAYRGESGAETRRHIEPVGLVPQVRTPRLICSCRSRPSGVAHRSPG